ncbi:hypothetical protein BJ742DRAFT_858826 [Cladochytrium replicatum]|nr:hypothetical protein BJ742DRAFT_858826 [Cladochytrium replicatum]
MGGRSGARIQMQFSKLIRTHSRSQLVPCGRSHILDWWRYSRQELDWSSEAFNIGSDNGHIHVLDWWLASGLSMIYTYETMDKPSIDNRMEVLQRGLELKYNQRAMDYASAEGLMERKRDALSMVLEWRTASGLELKWTNANMDFAFGVVKAQRARSHTYNGWNVSEESGRIDVLEWWRRAVLS